jgi:hypothetical protein
MKIKIIRGKHPLSIHVVWFVLLLSVLGFYRYLFQVNFHADSVCIFHKITGYPCLSCGLSRSVDAFFTYDFIGMFYYNPLAVLFFGGLFFFSLFKLGEFILGFKLNFNISKKAMVFTRITLLILIVANWLFLVVTGR